MFRLHSISRIARVASCAALCLIVVSGAAEAQRRGGGSRGGGMRGGGMRSGGGARARTSVSPSIGRSSAARPSRPSTPSVSRPSAPSVSRPSQLPSAPGRTGTAGGEIAGRGNVGVGNRGGNITGGGNRGGNITGGGNRGNISGGNRNNISGGGNVNIDRDGITNINNDVDWGWHSGYGYGWGYGAAAAAGAVVGAAVTSAVIGSTVYALPPSCVSSLYSGLTYYNCNDVWYQAQFVGDEVTYIVVEKP